LIDVTIRLFAAVSVHSFPATQALLENKLVLDNEVGQDAAGSGKWKNYFLCATIEDDDLPWDVNNAEF